MLPGKKYTPEDMLQVIRGRIWWLLLPVGIVTAVTALYARSLPDVFRSETAILVVPQRVPEEYVRSTVTARIEDRLQAIQPQILSRTRLEQIIQEFDLYADDRAAGTLMEDVVSRMRDDINVAVVRGDAFRISYVGRDPAVVRAVTDRLASLFINENLRDREVLAESTNQFLEAQLEEARRQLVDTERRLEAYRRQYAGELPSQLNSNLQQVQSANMQLQQLAESLNRDQERRLSYERQLEDLESSTALSALPVQSGSPSPSDSTLQQLAAARTQVADLSVRLKDGHPDLERARRVVRDLERKLVAESQQGGPAPTTVSPAQVERQRRVAEVRAQIGELDRQMAQKRQDQQRIRETASRFQQQADAVPTRESELTELTRDYTTLQALYTSLLTKKEESRIAANLERRQVGEQFRLLDPARQAERPFQPNRARINLIGLVVGMALGLGLVAFLEYRDATLNKDHEVVAVTGLPVLAVVPLMYSAADQRRMQRQRLLTRFGLGGTLLLCMAITLLALVR